MSVLVVGLSHKSAPLATLERTMVAGDALGKLLRDVSHADDVAGVFVISTCNRAEVYADVDKFHGGVAAICELLARHSGIGLPELTPHLYVHYEDRAVQHLLAVACGLDSMVIGESQILGQVRQALHAARDHGTLGRALADLGSHALRTGKRAHAETGIDQAGASLVSVGLAVAAGRLRGAAGAGPAPELGPGQDLLRGVSVLVVGAGSMSSLAVATAARMGAARIAVANRSKEGAQRLAATVAGTWAPLSRLAAGIAGADLVVSCTGAPGFVISAGSVRDGLGARPAGRPLVLLDLALPRDIDPDAGQLPGVSVLGLEIVAEEFAARALADRAARVAPTVVALRAKAAGVVEAELARLTGRLDSLDARSHREIAQSMRRVAEKLLHAPTVRVKELAGSPGADSYEAALRVLFDLDPDAVQAVVRADPGLVPPADGQEAR